MIKVTPNGDQSYPRFPDQSYPKSLIECIIKTKFYKILLGKIIVMTVYVFSILKSNTEPQKSCLTSYKIMEWRQILVYCHHWRHNFTWLTSIIAMVSHVSWVKMPRVHVRRSGSRRYDDCEDGAVDKAIHSCRKTGMGIRKAARAHRVPYGTLWGNFGQFYPSMISPGV